MQRRTPRVGDSYRHDCSRWNVTRVEGDTIHLAAFHRGVTVGAMAMPLRVFHSWIESVTWGRQ